MSVVGDLSPSEIMRDESTHVFWNGDIESMVRLQSFLSRYAFEGDRKRLKLRKNAYDCAR